MICIKKIKYSETEKRKQELVLNIQNWNLKVLDRLLREWQNLGNLEETEGLGPAAQKRDEDAVSFGGEKRI